MRPMRKTMIGLAVAAMLATGCPGNEDDSDVSPAPQSGTTGATAATGNVTGG